MSDVIIQQVLHGYSGGHKLLAGSIELPKEYQKVMLDQSDISGSIRDDDNYSCLTGYYLKDISSYVFAKTWYANEMDRPGCVYTHSLIISEKELKNQTLLFGLSSLFKRPLNPEDYNSYKNELVLFDTRLNSQSDLLLNSDPLVVVKKILSEFIATNFGSPVVCPRVNSLNAENICILSLAFFQTLNIRNFSFCSYSLSERFILGKPFNLQFIGDHSIHSFLRKSDRYQICDTENNLSTKTLLTDETLEKVLVLRSRDYVDKMIGLLKVTSLNDFSFVAKLLSLKNHSDVFCYALEEISKRYPGPEDARQLKRKFFNLDSLPEEYIENDLKLLLSDKRAECILYQDLIQDLHPMQSKVYSYISLGFLSQLSGLSLNVNGYSFIEALAFSIDPQLYFQLFPIASNVGFALAQVNPKLIVNKALWEEVDDYKLRLLDHTLKNLDKESYRTLLCIFLDLKLKNEALFTVMYEYDPAIYLFTTLDYFNEHDRKIPAAHSEFILKQPQLSYEWMSTNSKLCDNVLVQLSKMLFLKVRSIKVANRDSFLFDFESIQNRLSNEERIIVSKFLFSLALINNPVMYRDVLKVCAPVVIDYIESNSLPYNERRILESALPDVSWIHKWDLKDWIKKVLKDLSSSKKK